MDAAIERALHKAPKLKDGETGKTGAQLNRDYVVYIEYHTVGKTNVCDYFEKNDKRTF